MQIWSGTHVDDIALSHLCETYSGSGERMEYSDFKALTDWYRETYGFTCSEDQRPAADGTCGPTFQGIARFFLSSNTFALMTERYDLMRYADVAFYCKYAPSQVDMRNKSNTCVDKCAGIANCNPFPCLLWPDQPLTPYASNWHLAESLFGGGAIRHVNCDEKTHVFEDFLEAVFGQTSYTHEWADHDIKAASREFYLTCLVDKGSNSYILTIGPILSIFGGVMTIMTLFRRFHGPPWPELGINLLILSLIMILFGFWSISIGTVSEISQYAICGDTPAPVSFAGMRYDGRPCVDRNTKGAESWNPFVYELSLVYSTYVVGGVMTFLSVVMFLGLVTGFTETMMGDRFGKYLVSLNDMPNIKLPFPHHQSGPTTTAPSAPSTQHEAQEAPRPAPVEPTPEPPAAAPAAPAAAPAEATPAQGAEKGGD
eukprot:CAMPEP_0173392776 /NCGR_PEP_ID=MMETSP1356-20130122/21150_1 /TAXON_ID=77927 ORGANISM="Hemiselmis virescens, Strain PCC157" /NCGR_SAMPLE_ID=MMETSP1356 /ASSEMBLY_ACC=CAM_ASM_000847 /LENGTH=426 /DNA_ID=CAMNT_0014350679 /DNA_START=231 /DNA_END=1511 /DNA_ORIENTATION=+